MRLRYARRRETLLSALARELPDWRPSASGSGLYVLVDLPRDVDEPALLAAAARHGVGIEGLSLHSYTGECQPGLVVGYGYLAEPSIERGVRLLAEALGATSGTDQVGFGLPRRANACPAPEPLRNSG